MLINNTKTKKNEFFHGECLCGAVSFIIKGKLRKVIYCHCGQCMKTHGHFSAYTQVDKKKLEFLNDFGLKWYQSSNNARRGFCNECGASIFFERHGIKKISISAGMFKSVDEIGSKEHIFYDEKPGYYEVFDNLPKFSQYYSSKF